MADAFIVRRGGGSVIKTPQYSYTGISEFIDDGHKNWRLKFLTSGTLTLMNDQILDVFCVGGGGGGHSAAGNAAGGGGGGYTNTARGIPAVSGVYEIVVGNGGAARTRGGTSSAFGISADGGKGATTGTGANGGSGGGAGARDGGSDGSDGFPYSSGGAVGEGQNSTTREFGDPSGTLYSGGGGGGYRSGQPTGHGGEGGGGDGSTSQTGSGSNGAANTGGGGGGAYNATGGSGGSGIVIIRNRR